ncbi:MAG: ubiquinol-cytochrome c reductase iron-sulfur subunit [Acidovorax sp.]|nr:ubiquinol-cytochrome c reductase iron-sulfur subunit [Acidovorax sp.]
MPLPSPAAALTPHPPTGPGDTERRQMVVLTTAAGCVAAAGLAVPLVSSFAPSERARAMGASVEVDIGDLPPGGVKTVEWRGKPVWIMRRTPDMLAALPLLDHTLADPASRKDQQPEYARNPQRSIRPDVFVTVGICTHLGCSPSTVPAGTAHPSVGDNWPGGFFCPCHGSTFDLAGRVFKNKPAPTNLEVPPHHYVSDTRLRIGDGAA